LSRWDRLRRPTTTAASSTTAATTIIAAITIHIHTGMSVTSCDRR
jgi:hypothetical protein